MSQKPSVIEQFGIAFLSIAIIRFFDAFTPVKQPMAWAAFWAGLALVLLVIADFRQRRG
jgi:hypothetical protein